MDLQKFVDGFELTTCILSVEKFDDGSYGNVKIVCGNKAYIDSIENPFNGASSHMLNNKFIPGSPYEKYIPKDLNFEQTVYRCAFEKKPAHNYLKLDRFDCWINQYTLPVASDEPNIGYCSYTLDITMEADAGIMTHISASTASSVLETCIKLRSSGDFEQSVGDVISDIRALCDANRCCLLLIDHNEETCSIIAESIRKGSPDEENSITRDENFYDVAKTWDDTIAGSNCLIIQGVQDMNVLKQRNPIWYESLMEAGIKTLVLFPLKQNTETLGYLWALNFDPAKSHIIKETLELTTYFIASEIANHKLLRQLDMMSSMDLLTGLYNRNAMNRRVDRYINCADPTPDSYGIIFADLNGLKTVNDVEGHSAGDRLLRRAAAKLKETFADCDIYRAGGDEFMIIAVGIPRDVLEGRIEALRRESGDPANVSFALGLCYEDSRGDIRNAMRSADERMYADKEQYYRRYPERRKR
ncbi:MAG: GGDEF domain-containing protein [Oscillospiraceae bacterium]|nr:GGDEF domain-containing protein [Oscillospiraceae bacterium]